MAAAVASLRSVPIAIGVVDGTARLVAKAIAVGVSLGTAVSVGTAVLPVGRVDMAVGVSVLMMPGVCVGSSEALGSGVVVSIFVGVLAGV